MKDDLKPTEKPAPARRGKPSIESDDRLLDINDVCAFTRLSRDLIGDMVARKEFPKPLLVPPNSRRPRHRWTLRQVKDWIKRLEVAA